MLELKNISKSFAKPVLSDFSYSFGESGLYLIKGSSGKGKTTLLRIIAGLTAPDSGSISGIENKKISYLFQDTRLLNFYTLQKNIEIVRKDKNEERIKEILEEFDLWNARESYPDELSGGMKRRAAIARSIYFEGDIFLWDEPTKELDRENSQIIANRMIELSKEHLMIAVTHDDILDDIATIINI